MLQQIHLGEITVDVTFKNIKNIHLSVYPPTGKVRISAPSGTNIEKIRVYAISKLTWIKKNQKKLRNQLRESPRDFVERESHYFFGKRYLLRISETDLAQTVVLRHREIELVVRKAATKEQRKRLLEHWYRVQLKEKAARYIFLWQKRLRLTVEDFGIRKMRTKWGSCNSVAKRIWINLELVKKPEFCLEYVIVHEMLHLIERKHDSKFVAEMDRNLPHWRASKRELNRLPIGSNDVPRSERTRQ